MTESEEKYGDIINNPRPESKHPRLPMRSRAAQFSPFAALSGYEDLIAEASRETVEQIELSEDQKNELDVKLSYLYGHRDVCGDFTVFVKDPKKAGGKYVSVRGCVLKYDYITHMITLDTGDVICANEIYDISFAAAF